MSEMVERVARAIEATYEQFADPTPAQRARAAIEAMREPTGEMCQAAMLTAVRENKGIEYAPSQGWQAMIDECLK